jgi:hypothetical protein
MKEIMLSPMEILGVSLASLLALPIVFGFCLRSPRLVTTGFIVLLFCFASSNWGVDVSEMNTLYTRGTGIFYVPLVCLVLMVGGVAVAVRKLANPGQAQLGLPLAPYMAAFALMMVGHMTIGLASGIPFYDIMHNNGVVNWIYMFVFMAMVTMAFHTEDDKKKLLYLFLSLAFVRAVFGLVRYMLMGGDDANPYRNFEKLDIKIFYFDIADNYVAALAAFILAWLLVSPRVKISLGRRFFLLGFLALEVAAVALSFRRSSLIGMGLMFTLLFFILPWRRRIFLSVLAVGALAATAFTFFQQRLKFNADSGGLLKSLFYDVAPDKNINQSRWYELYAAAQSMSDGWLFGLGSWGTYEGDRATLDYHFGKLDFVHSGFGHIVLKTGLVGLALFIAMLGAFIAHYLRHRKYLQGNSRLLADAGMASLMFWIPTLLVGTPMIEFRTMLMFGLSLALVYIATGPETSRVRAYAVA